MSARIPQFGAGILLAGVLAFTVARGTHADAPNSNFVNGTAATTAAAHSNLSQPGYRTVSQDPDFSSRMTRIGGDSSVVITGYHTNGSYPDSVWGRDARHHYSKDPVWNSSESLMWIQNAQGASGQTFRPDSKVKRMFLDGTSYLPLPVLSAWPVFRDSMDEMRWHPVWSNVAYFVYDASHSPSGTTKVVMGDVARKKILKSWIIPGQVTWKSEGGVSDDGRFTVLASNQATSTDDITAVVLDFYQGTAGYDSAGTGHSGLGSWDTTIIHGPNISITGSQTLDHFNISSKGKYAVAKYSSSDPNANSGETTRLPQDQQRVLVRGTSPGVSDTSSLHLRPMTMQSDAPRFGTVDSLSAVDGWIYPMSHSDVNTDSTGAEVIVGGGRAQSYQNNVSGNISGGHHNTAEADSGKVIMVDLATGYHWHVSSGRSFNSDPIAHRKEECGVQHTSGRATSLRGWQCVSYDHTDSTLRFEDEVVFWKLTRNANQSPWRSGWRMGVTRTDIANFFTSGSLCSAGCGLPGSPCYRDEPHVCPSPTGTRVAFPSDWRWWATGGQGTCDQPKGYVMDVRGMTARAALSYVYWSDESGLTGPTNIVVTNVGATPLTFASPSIVGEHSSELVVTAPSGTLNWLDTGNLHFECQSPTGALRQWTVTFTTTDGATSISINVTYNWVD